MLMMKERAARFPDGGGLGEVNFAGGRRHPRMRGGWLDEGSRSSSFQPISAVRRPSGRGDRSRPSRALRDRRYLPGVPAGACLKVAEA
jgi:hypothetical protein